MKFKIISRANGKLVHALMAEGGHFNIGDYVDEVGSGQAFDLSMLQDIRPVLEKIIEEHSEGKTPGKEFDSLASVAIHKSLKIPPEVSGNDGFWRWLTLVEFSDIVEWRHPVEDGIANAANYGIGTIWNGLFARLWYQAEIVYSAEAKEPYELVKYGGVDTWRSHILRVNTGSCRNYARSLLRFLHQGQKKSRLKVIEIRELAKKVRRIQATVALELLTEEDAYTLIERLAATVQEEMST